MTAPPSAAAEPAEGGGKIRFAEEITLLLLSENTGCLVRFSDRKLNYVLAAAILAELALEDRIDNDLHDLKLVDPTPLDDRLLDPSLRDIEKNPQLTNLQQWLDRIARRGPQIRTATLKRLAARGILESEEEGLLFLTSSYTRTRRYVARDGAVMQDVLSRIMRLLLSDDIPDPRDILIICLVHACGLFEKILSREELDDAGPRIDILSRMDAIGLTMMNVVRGMAAKVDERPQPAKGGGRDIPTANGLPILGNLLDLRRDLSGFFVREYRKSGPLFRIRLLNRRLLAMVGPEANEFVARHGHLCLSTHFPWSGYNEALGTTRTLMGLEGPDHARLRRAQAYGYSRQIFEKNVGRAAGILEREMKDWRPGAVLPGFHTMQKLVIEQIGQISGGCSPGDYHADLAEFLDHIIKTTVVKNRPRFLSRRQLRRSGARLRELSTRAIRAWHGGGERRSFFSDMLDLHRRDPLFLSEVDLHATFLAPFLAGLDTIASTCAFALHVLLTNPELLARVRAEADRMFAAGRPDVEQLRAADVTTRVLQETLRVYTVAPALVRQVSNSFEFNGCSVDRGETVMVMTGATHRLPECFPEPQRFDIDRYLPERGEDRQSYAYVPFGLGHHRCLGSGMAVSLGVLTLAAVARWVDVSLHPPGYRLKIISLPTQRPDRRFRFRVVARR